MTITDAIAADPAAACCLATLFIVSAVLLVLRDYLKEKP